MSVAIIGDSRYSQTSSFYVRREVRQETYSPTVSIRSRTQTANTNATLQTSRAEPLGPASYLQTAQARPSVSVGTKSQLQSPSVSVTSKKTTLPFQLLHAIENLEKSGVLEGLKGLFETLYDHYSKIHDSHSRSLKIAHVSLDQFHATQNVLGRCAGVIGKPRISYLPKWESIIAQWPCEVHESTIDTLNDLFTEHVISLVPEKLVSVTLRHNTELKNADGGSTIPDFCLRLYSNNPPNIAYPAVCQIAFSESFDDALDVIESMVEGNPSIRMVLLLNIKESPAFSRPSSNSVPWRIFSKEESVRTFAQFTSISSRARKTDNVFTDPVIAAQHVWCSIANVDFYVWLRDPSTGELDVRTTSDEYSAHGTMPSNAGMDSVQQMIARGLAFVRESIAVFCREVMLVSTRAADLGPFENHVSTIDSVLLDSFRQDLANAALVTAHARYIDWFHKSFRGTKRSHDDDDEEYVPPSNSTSTTANSVAGSSLGDRCRQVRPRT